MGNFFSDLFNSFPRDLRLVMIGLDGAGKTTVLYKLKVPIKFAFLTHFKLGEVVSTIPTIGFNVETVKYKNINFNVWDVGGQDRIRTLWKHYYAHTDGIIYVVDAADRDRVPKAAQQLQKVLSEDELTGASLLVLANKQDLPNAMSVAELAEKLGLPTLRSRQWHIQGSCATTGDGLYEGLDWLSRSLK